MCIHSGTDYVNINLKYFILRDKFKKITQKPK